MKAPTERCWPCRFGDDPGWWRLDEKWAPCGEEEMWVCARCHPTDGEPIHMMTGEENED